MYQPKIKKVILPILLLLGLLLFVGCGIFSSDDSSPNYEWEEVFVEESPPDFYSIAVVPNSHRVVAVGSQATVFISDDDGDSWYRQEMPNVDMTLFRKVMFINHLIGFIFDNHNIWRTDDGGNSWFHVYETHETYLLDICFSTPMHGFVSCGHRLLLETHDGGNTWQWNDFFSSFQLKYDFNDVTFVTPQKGFLVGENRRSSIDTYILWETNDGGQTWIFKDPIKSFPEEAYPNSLAFSQIEFADEQTGFLIHKSYPGDAWISHDGGQTWESWNHWYKSLSDFSSPVGIKTFYPLSRDVIYVAGNRRMILKTLDGGLTWKTVKVETKSYDNCKYEDICFREDGMGFAVASYPGQIFRSKKNAQY